MAGETCAVCEVAQYNALAYTSPGRYDLLLQHLLKEWPLATALPAARFFAGRREHPGTQP